jgi:hypothetical protein
MPVSHLLTLTRKTPRRRAKSSWESPNLRRHSFNSFPIMF